MSTHESSMQQGLGEQYPPYQYQPQEPVAVVDQPAERERRHTGRNIVMGVVGVAAVVGSVLLLRSCDTDNDIVPVPPTPTEKSCEVVKDKHASSNSEKYTSSGLFPRAEEFKNSADIKAYVNRLFDKDGPLANNGDYASIAAGMGAFGAPSHDGEALNPNYDVLAIFADRFAAYRSEGGSKAAAEDCNKLRETLVQDARLRNEWAKQGDIVTQLVAVRDLDEDSDDFYSIQEVKFEKAVVKSEEGLSGLELELRDTSKGLDAYYSVLITNDGQFYFKGLSVGDGGSVKIGDQNPGDVDEELSPQNQGDSPFAGGEIDETTIDDDGNVTTTGRNANGDTVIETTAPNGTTTVTIVPVGGGTPTVTVTIPGPAGPGTTVPGPGGPGPTTPGTTTPGGPGTTVPGPGPSPTTTIPRYPTTTRPTTTTPPTTPPPTSPTTTRPTTTTPPTSPPTTAPFCPPPKIIDPNGVCKNPNPGTTAPPSPY